VSIRSFIRTYVCVCVCVCCVFVGRIYLIFAPKINYIIMSSVVILRKIYYCRTDKANRDVYGTL